jgi:hypothetical protein
MVQHAPVGSQPPWAYPGGLFDLLDYLREHGFRITTSEYAVVHELMAAMIDRGLDLSDPNIVKSHLGPVLCWSARDQASFSSHFDRWTSRHAPTREPRPGVENDLEQASRGWRVWRWVLAAVCVAVAIAAVAWWRTSVPATVQVETPPLAREVVPTQTVSRAGFSIALVSAVSFVLTALSWGAWWFYRGRMFLKRQPTVDEPDLLSISLENRLPEVVEEPLRRIARQMRRRRAVPSSVLDVGRTTEEAVRRNGVFTPVFGTQYVQPEYVILIDRRSFRDQGAGYLDELAEELTRAQVWITRYYFDEDPRVLVPRDGINATTLRDLCLTSHDRRMLFFADAAVLLDPVSADLAVWTEPLRLVREAALFTPKPREHWSSAEERAKRVVAIYSATLSSVEDFVMTMAGVPVADRPYSAAEGPFPWELSLRPERWLERDGPDSAVIEDALGSVRRYLGPDGYFWLAACAVYPEIHFNLTEYLGTTLKGADGFPLFTTDRFTALSRLPWMHNAYMPDWLRLRLVTSLDPEHNQQIRDALNALWLSVATGGTRPIELEIARLNPLAVTAMARSMFRKLRHRARERSVLRDRVFASIMLGRSLEPLAVRIPRMWRTLMRRGAQEATGGLPEGPREKWVRRCHMGLMATEAAAGAVLSVSAGYFGFAPLDARKVLFIQCITGPLGLFAGIVLLNRRLLWSNWLLIAALFPSIFLGAWIAPIAMSSRATVIHQLPPRPTQGASLEEAQKYNEAIQMYERRQMNFSGQQKMDFGVGTYCLFCLGLLAIVHRVVRKGKVAPTRQPWQKLLVKIVFWAAILGQAGVPIVVWVAPTSSDYVALWLVGLHFVGMLEMFPGIRTGSRLLIGHGLVTAAFPLLGGLTASALPDQYMVPSAFSWAIVFTAGSLWVAHRLGGQVPLVRWLLAAFSPRPRKLETAAPR